MHVTSLYCPVCEKQVKIEHVTNMPFKSKLRVLKGAPWLVGYFGGEFQVETGSGLETRSIVFYPHEDNACLNSKHPLFVTAKEPYNGMVPAYVEKKVPIVCQGCGKKTSLAVSVWELLGPMCPACQPSFQSNPADQ